MTILEALQHATQELKRAGRQDSAQLDAEVLLAHVLDVPKTKLFARLNDQVETSASETFHTLLARRCKGEPVAYITGTKEFYKRLFQVNEHVLIPRPATETLVEQALAIAASSNPELTLFADIGTGSGAIAVTLATESELPVAASDVSPQAVEIARANARLHEVEELMDVRQGDLLAPLQRLFQSLASTNARFETLIICANLPYLTDAQWQNAQIELHFEPLHALRAGHDGLDCYWRLLRELARARSYFPEQLFLLMEIDPAQTHRARQIVEHHFPGTTAQIKKDLDGFNRVLIVKGV